MEEAFGAGAFDVFDDEGQNPEPNPSTSSTSKNSDPDIKKRYTSITVITCFVLQPFPSALRVLQIRVRITIYKVNFQ